MRMRAYHTKQRQDEKPARYYLTASVDGAALDQRQIAEHAADRAGERRGAVDHHQDRPGGVQAPLP
jgi:hypothetical protein